jgi:hypothetical protein
MKIPARLLVAVSLLALAAASLVPRVPAGIGFVGDAHAIIGMPMTPVSYAGVARRTAYREVAVASTAAVVTTAAVATASAEAAAASQQAAARAAAAPPAPPPGSLAVGTVVMQLPGGCVSAPIGGVEYYLCNGTYFRSAFQGNNLVYVVQRP